MRSIMIRNATNSPIHVRPHLRGGWQAADFVIGFTEFALGLNDLKGVLMAAGLSDIPKAISTFEDVHKVLGGLRQVDDGVIDLKVLRGTEKGVKGLKDKMKYVAKRFKQTTLPIAAGETKDVFDRELLDEVTTPDGIASLLGAKTVAIAIVTEDGTQDVVFDSSDAAQWVMTPAGAFNKKDLHRVHRWIRVPLTHRK
jgi:hypothetical protein